MYSEGDIVRKRYLHTRILRFFLVLENKGDNIYSAMALSDSGDICDVFLHDKTEMYTTKKVR